MRLILGICFSILTTLSPILAEAQSSGLRRLTDRDDLFGWEAVGRLDMGRQKYCTGTLIAADLVLTAAHCVYDKSGRLFPTDKILFRAGLRDGTSIAERKAQQVAVAAQYDVRLKLSRQSVRHDVALIRLAAPISTQRAAPFSVHSGSDYGSDISVTSYGRGRSDALSRQRNCNLLNAHAGIFVIDCNVTFGSSGAPVFSKVGNRARILSIVSSGGTRGGRQVAFGMALPDRIAELKAQLRRAPSARSSGGIRRVQVNSGLRNSATSTRKTVRPGG